MSDLFERDRPPPVHLVVVGATGRVGGALLRQLARVAPERRNENTPDLRISAAFGRSRGFGKPSGVLPEKLDAGGLTGDAPDLDTVLTWLEEGRLSNAMVVDCTASREVADRYLSLLRAGASIVTANKVAWSSSLERWRELHRAAEEAGTRVRYETTVGAALPIIVPSRSLRAAGDRLRTVSGVLSGTLAYIFGRLREGEPFSTAVRQARDAGYTEPHPRDDLSGLDVARKLLILLRAWGLEVEPSQIPVEGLVPDHVAGEQDPEVFLAGLHVEDARWRRRLADAREKGGALVYVASFEGGAGRVGVRIVPRDHPLAGLEGTENRVMLTTDRFTPVPLTVSGPGAGVELTATGVLADILEVARR